MANTKRHFISGKMNKGVDERLVPNGEYIDALNVRLGSTEQSEIGSVENSKGNTQLTTLEFDGNALSSNARCIGAFEDGTRETIYWFIHDRSFTGINPAGAALDLIVSLNVKEDILTYHVISTSVLNFNPTYLITGIDMVEYFLFFTDDYNAPRFIDINKNYAEPSGGVDQFTAEELLVIKKPPLTAPTFTLNFTPGEEDYIEERFLCFAYRYKYENNQYSATSQFSEPAFTPKAFQFSSESFLNEGMVNSKNQVVITYNSGGPLVVGIDLLFKESGTNIIKVIQKLDKKQEGLADNTDYTFDFNSNKIFTILPDSELLRLFDNVPRFAQAQTVMGNRLFYGNYVDGYNLKDKNNNALRLEYEAELSSSEISIEPLTKSLSSFDFTIDGTVAVPDSKLTVDFTGVELTVGSQLDFSFSITHQSFSNTASPTDIPVENSGTTIISFSYVLPSNFATINDLATSTDFINKIGTALNIKPVFDAVNPTSCSGTTFTDNYNCGITPVLDSSLATTWTKFASGQSADGQPILIGSSVGSNNLELTMLAMRRVDDTAAPTLNVYEYFSMSNVNVTLSSSPSSLSLHSNRNYEVGIIYMDEFNRATTALVSEFNAVNVPCGNAYLQNKIKVTIPPQQLAPSFATRYKFCLKPDREGYETIYSNIYFLDPLTSNTFFLLEGENAQKVEEGSRLIVKRDSNGYMSDCRYATVLEKKAQTEDFINVAGVTVPAGTYMKILANDFAATIASDDILSPGLNTTTENTAFNYPIQVYFGLSGGTGASSTSPGAAPYGVTIPQGSLIKVEMSFVRQGGGLVAWNEQSLTVEAEYRSANDYTNIIDWFIDNDIATSLSDLSINSGNPTSLQFLGTTNSTANNYGLDLTADNTKVFYKWFLNSPGDNEIRFITKGVESKGSTNAARSTTEVRWEIIRAENVIAFETEPSDALPDVWYEGSESYAIDQATGFHQGSDGVYQTSTTPAIVDTDFGNCYAYGNGVESYRVRDSIKGKDFNLGERVFSTSAEDYQEADRFAALTYSGVFNTETNVNKLNEFNLGILNFKNLEESFGPIQIISGRETDILTLQEDKISYVQSGKNLLSDAAGGSAVTSVPEVLGTQIARVEEYGISSNPESFVQYGYDKFFTDAKRGALIQLRGSGQNEQLTVLSELGMRSWFRDLFLGSFDTQKLGAFDPYMNEFVLASNTQKLPSTPVVINCGVQRRLTVTAATPVSFTVNVGDTVGTCAISYNIISFSDPGSITIAEDYTGTSTNINTTGAGTFNFNKNSVADEDVVITLTSASAPPGGKQVVVLDITVGCPQAIPLNIIEVCITNPTNSGKFIHNQYSWVSGTFTSPIHSKQIAMRTLGSGTGPYVIEDYTQISATQGGGIIPIDGATVSVTSNAIPPSDNYKFPAGTANSLMFLRSSTLYANNVTDINLLIAAATDITPSPVVTPTVTGTFTMPTGNPNDYLYIIHNYYN